MNAVGLNKPPLEDAQRCEAAYSDAAFTDCPAGYVSCDTQARTQRLDAPGASKKMRTEKRLLWRVADVPTGIEVTKTGNRKS